MQTLNWDTANVLITVIWVAVISYFLLWDPVNETWTVKCRWCVLLVLKLQVFNGGYCFQWWFLSQTGSIQVLVCFGFFLFGTRGILFSLKMKFWAFWVLGQETSSFHLDLKEWVCWLQARFEDPLKENFREGPGTTCICLSLRKCSWKHVVISFVQSCV